MQVSSMEASSGPGLLWLRPTLAALLYRPMARTVGPKTPSHVPWDAACLPGTAVSVTPVRNASTLHVGQGFITPRLCFIELGSAGSA